MRFASWKGERFLPDEAKHNISGLQKKPSSLKWNSCRVGQTLSLSLWHPPGTTVIRRCIMARHIAAEPPLPQGDFAQGLCSFPTVGAGVRPRKNRCPGIASEPPLLPKASAVSLPWERAFDRENRCPSIAAEPAAPTGESLPTASVVSHAGSGWLRCENRCELRQQRRAGHVSPPAVLPGVMVLTFSTIENRGFQAQF